MFYSFIFIFVHFLIDGLIVQQYFYIITVNWRTASTSQTFTLMGTILRVATSKVVLDYFCVGRVSFEI